MCCLPAQGIDPIFLEPPGLYPNEVMTIHLSAEAGDIHYTTNGVDPTVESPLYEEEERP